LNQSHTSLRLILGDQLNIKHHWFDSVNPQVIFVLMEVKSESEYVRHHVQKVVGIFDAMRRFSSKLKQQGHKVHYVKINDADNKHEFRENLIQIIQDFKANDFHYQLPDEYRLEKVFEELKAEIKIPVFVSDTNHFLTKRGELKEFFQSKKRYTLEYFYRNLRKRNNVLMGQDNNPIMGKWNFDQDNRKKVPQHHDFTTTSIKTKDLSNLLDEIKTSGIRTIGEIEATKYSWTTTREEALGLLEEFIQKSLQLFGTLQDAMTTRHWYLYHSRLSFALNIKLISPLEVVQRIELAYHEAPEKYAINQVEGFIRQVLGWREYMRGIYWAEMPSFSKLNFFNHKRKLPGWYWNGNTKMNCKQFH
jgi:deoxyribodipyrimidine photolyase-related protein